MRRLATLTLVTCSVALWLLFSMCGLLLAQEVTSELGLNVPVQEEQPRFVEGAPNIPDVTSLEDVDGMFMMEVKAPPVSPPYPYAREQKQGVELKKEELEKTLRSHGDAGLVTMLRFEKARVLRKAGLFGEAVAELRKIIETNLADKTTIAARWTLAEILQEQKRNEEAIAELERIFVSASEIQDRMDAMYGIINLSGEGQKARIRAIDRLIQALLTNQANWDKCMNNLQQLYAAERKYAEDHDGHLSEELSDLYPDYADSLDLFTCPASDDPKITRKGDIDSLSSYVLVAKGKPVEDGEPANISPYDARFRGETWIREKEHNHGRRCFLVSSDGSVGWSAR